mmetsp:Transcript_114418/g.363665  ORF Transcript_114418/g.363665 Transcript_114418/m.363665 type:complete len:353 (-) Transcript_114418:695-1753(-)
MSTIVCAISGQPPEEPQFYPKTGHVYEKRLILKNIESSGKCPVTKEELTQDDLVGMKANKAVRPRPAAATSIPGMLSLLQSEWDALMTETYELKTNLDTTRKQLSHALYQHDAACRVVARLLRERDASRAQVQQLQEQLANSRPLPAGISPADDDSAEIGLTPDILQRMTECSKALSKTRKKRDFPDLAPVSDVKRLSCVGSHPTHQSTAPGILCIDVNKNDDPHRDRRRRHPGYPLRREEGEDGCENGGPHQEGHHRCDAPSARGCPVGLCGQHSACLGQLHRRLGWRVHLRHRGPQAYRGGHRHLAAPPRRLLLHLLPRQVLGTARPHPGPCGPARYGPRGRLHQFALPP